MNPDDFHHQPSVDPIDPDDRPARLGAIVRRWSDATPHAPALHDGQRCWTYAALAAAVGATAASLRALGVRAGDRLMVVGENCAAQVALTFAAADIDAVVVHVNGRLSAPEIDRIRHHCQPRRVIYTSAPGCAASPETAAHGLRHDALPGEGPCGAWMVGALNPDCAPDPVHGRSDQQVAALVYTTGTTSADGAPKGVMLSHRNLLFVAAVSSRLRALTPLDRAYGVLPITHVYGMTSMMLGTLYAGACLVLCPRYTPNALLAALHDHRLTIVQGVPAMYARLLEKLGRDDMPVPNHLRFAYAGGSPLAPSLKARVERVLGVPLHNGYGLTETAPTVCQTRLDQPRTDTSVGHVIPGVAAQVVDAGGAPVASGVTGALWVRGPNLMLGYYRDPELTAASMRPGGWFDTGDLARQDADGALFIVGRSKELIIHGGFNVYPLEVETVLNAHPGVTQSAVVGRARADGDEDVVAYIEPDTRHPVALDALHTWLAQHLAPYKRPTEIVAMATLPSAATGKILKGQLKALADGSQPNSRAPGPPRARGQ
ncbi:long-chain fatty acid--CoA ligase [Duganella sp. Leaf126]|uniref:class I adenylate-forming enzyme family protein n=1 Tax=Duganella sp. Leaf126 TaxID=1736266 RepID=UPI0006F5B380|nr:AMP-binding protein [Duganella sp. Leaf126]KQQ40207.1 long-chain fatty acid--CoA ligase [Duganella sp. Leaf126]